MKRFMMLSIVLVGLLAAAMPGFAATSTPDQQGTWDGTLTSKTYVYNTGEVLVRKQNVRLTINENDTWGMGLVDTGAIIDSGTGTFGVGGGFLRGAISGQTVVVTLHYKNGKIKGTLTLGLHDPSGAYLEGKLNLKRVFP